MTSFGADKTFAHSGTKLNFDPKLPFAEGDRIADKFEVIGLVGSGGMAFVVAARYLELNEIVALKFLKPEYLADTDLVERFAREARALAKIENEHVSRIYDVGTMPDGAPFIVMEYLEGKDLGALLREEGPAPVECACEFLLQGCEALAAAHAIGIVHRDVKPDNLFLAQCTQGLDVIKLLDFGISKLAVSGVVDGTGPHVSTTALMGTPVYMSPEQIRASSDLDARTDIWSLGCVLYELLTGDAPFKSPSITALTASILERPAPLLRTRRPDVPPELEAVVTRCLAKDPNHRFQSVSQLAAALRPFAPRRAQLSVERCSQILRHAGKTSAPLVLQSIPPPRKDSKPAAAPKSAAEGTPRKSEKPPRTSEKPPRTSEKPPRTSEKPRSVDLLLPPPTPARRRKAPLIAGICILVAAGAFAARRSHVDTNLDTATSIATAVTKGTPALAAAATAPAPATAEMIPHVAAIADVTRIPTTTQLDAVDTKTPPVASAASKPKSPRKPRTPKSNSTSQEIDVGF
jgi:serine/threonine-protein kinase